MSRQPGQRFTFWDAIAAFPPYYVRMLAKTGRRALSDAEIAIASGIEINRVREIKCLTNWDAVTMGEFLRFTTACNFDPTNPRDRQRIDKYERICRIRNQTPFAYLRRSPKWESELLPLLKNLQERLSRKSCAA